jgi:transcriptional regulator with XRE-family HTH domain
LKSLHAVLKQGREATGMTQPEAAEKLGMKSRELISKYENGREKPSAQLLMRMIDLYKLNYTIGQLMALKAQPENGLTNDELNLLRAYRNNDVEKAMKLIADKAYGQSTKAA